MTHVDTDTLSPGNLVYIKHKNDKKEYLLLILRDKRAFDVTRNCMIILTKYTFTSTYFDYKVII